MAQSVDDVSDLRTGVRTQFEEHKEVVDRHPNRFVRPGCQCQISPSWTTSRWCIPCSLLHCFRFFQPDLFLTLVLAWQWIAEFEFFCYHLVVKNKRVTLSSILTPREARAPTIRVPHAILLAMAVIH